LQENRASGKRRSFGNKTEKTWLRENTGLNRVLKENQESRGYVVTRRTRGQRKPTAASTFLGTKQHGQTVNDPQMSKFVAELTLAPFGDEILPVRSRELQTNAFIQNQLQNSI